MSVELVRVGDWTVDPVRNLLTRPGAQVHLEPKAMQLLVALADRPGECVTKTALVDSVWEGRFVTDDAVTSAMSQLRRALGDDARRPRYVQTIPRQGYRLVASVRPIDPETKRSAPRRAVSTWSTRAATVALVAASLALVPATDPAESGSTPPLNFHAPRTDSPRSPAATAAYLSGRRHLTASTFDAPLDARADCSRAVEIDPSFAQAWECLAESRLRTLGVTESARDGLVAMAEAADHALRLDPTLTRAAVCRAVGRYAETWQFEPAEATITSLLERDPGDAFARYWLGLGLASVDRLDDALDQLEHAVALDPRYDQGTVELVRFAAGDRDTAIAALRSRLDREPGNQIVRWSLVQTLWASGLEEDAYRELHTFQAQRSPDPVRVRLLEDAYARGGLREAALVDLEIARLMIAKGAAVNLVQVASLEAAIGRPTAALDLLEEARRLRDPDLLLAPIRPLLGPVHDTARFRRLLPSVDVPS